VTVVVAMGATPDSDRGWRGWRDPFTAMFWRGLPGAVADALDSHVHVRRAGYEPVVSRQQLDFSEWLGP
jgi:hypothetical protein